MGRHPEGGQQTSSSIRTLNSLATEVSSAKGGSQCPIIIMHPEGGQQTSSSIRTLNSLATEVSSATGGSQCPIIIMHPHQSAAQLDAHDGRGQQEDDAQHGVRMMHLCSTRTMTNN